MNDLSKAAAVYEDILRREPANVDALYRLGIALMQLKRAQDALSCFTRAAALAPANAHIPFQHAAALAQLQRQDEAIAALDAALALKPDFAEAWNNRGNALLALRRPREALASFDRAVALLPQRPQVWNNRANALAELKRFDEAVADYSRALGFAPGDAGILNHRAIAHFEAKRYGEAARDFSAVLARAPDFDYARGNLVYSRLHICDWAGLDEEKALIGARLSAGAHTITPIQLAALSGSPEDQLHAATLWAADKYAPAGAPLWRGETYRHDRIRIAYLSADFHAHATAALMAGVFEQHDRKRFEIHAASYGRDDGSLMRRRLLGAFEHFHDFRDSGDRSVAETLRRLEIDIAVDLKGYTQESRPGILSHRPAPVQAQYLGFPGSMGAGFIDYILADAVVVPDAHHAFYGEKVIALPGSYQCNDDTRTIAHATMTRSDAGLPETGFVFCCFNNNYKIGPDIFAMWMRLLAAVEGSVLWLLEDNRMARDNLCREAERLDVAATRLVFAPRMAPDMHLARHRLADLFLDTLPYGAHTTASDALWAGLPVLTCLGSAFAGRVAASLNRAVGLPELVVESLADYETMALRLAGDPEMLAGFRTRLSTNRATAPLFDTKRFTRTLETAYAAMWERAQRGQPPAPMTIEEAL